MQVFGPTLRNFLSESNDCYVKTLFVVLQPAASAFDWLLCLKSQCSQMNHFKHNRPHEVTCWHQTEYKNVAELACEERPF